LSPPLTGTFGYPQRKRPRVVGTVHAKNAGVSSKLSARGDAKGASCGDFSSAFLLFAFYEGWQQRRVDKKRLANMRENFKLGRHFDVSKGQWGDD
jgi:hypothetical protein